MACLAPSAEFKPLIVSTGGHSVIERVSDTIVAKAPILHPDWESSAELIYIEAIIHQRLGPHPCITKF
jgi:hypothetical protein